MVPENVGEWTSGIIICRPNRTLYDHLALDITERSDWGSNMWVAQPNNPGFSSDGHYRNDQRYLGEFFLRKHKDTLPARWLDPYHYHANPVMCRGYPPGQPPAPELANFTWADVKLTHFGCVSKPWHDAGKPRTPMPDCFEGIVATWRAHFAAAMAEALQHPAVTADLKTRLLDLAGRALQPRKATA